MAALVPLIKDANLTWQKRLNDVSEEQIKAEQLKTQLVVEKEILENCVHEA